MYYTPGVLLHLSIAFIGVDDNHCNDLHKSSSAAHTKAGEKSMSSGDSARYTQWHRFRK